MSSVSTPTLPPEFSHPSLQELLREGTASGSVQAASLRTACEDAQVPMKRMKAVLRALEAAEVTVVVEQPAPAKAAAKPRAAAKPAAAKPAAAASSSSSGSSGSASS